MDPVLAQPSLKASQSSRKRPLSDTEDDDSDREDMKRLRSTSTVSNAGVAATEAAREAQDANKSKKDKKRRQKKKKRKLPVVEEGARAEKPPSERRSQASPNTRLAGDKPQSKSPGASVQAETRAKTPVAGPSAETRERSVTLAKTEEGGEVTENAASVDMKGEENDFQSVSHKEQPDKGKGRASLPISRRGSPISIQLPQDNLTQVDTNAASSSAEGSTSATISGLQSQLSSQQNLLTSLLPSLTCRVCLYLMNRPFALAPCGHVVCHGCLVSWFSAPPQNGPNVLVDPPPPPPGPVVANGQAPAPAAAAAPANPPPPRPPSAIFRKKTCPHCRAVVRDRPVEVWEMKEMVASVTKSGLVQDQDVIGPATPDPPTSEDPWKNIFPSVARHNGDAGPDMPPAVAHELMGIQDAEDGGVYRCVECMHEIWDGVCSNCHREYEGHLAPWLDDSGSDDDLDDYMYGGNLVHSMLHRMGLGMLGGGRNRNEDDVNEVDEDDDDSEGFDYQDSFIDDDEGPMPRVQYNVSSSEDEDEDNSDVQIMDGPGPSAGTRSRRRRPRRRVASPIVISSDEDPVDEPHPNLWRRALGGIPLVMPSVSQPISLISDDEAEDGSSDDGLADEVAARELAVYGDDGSVPRRSSNVPEYHMPEDEDSEDESRYAEHSESEDGASLEYCVW
ncbi:hypothetical protein EIP91_005761 [Steccherinum ochraceum]|uniref:RING-type domain-containing protein n=1 Tax=Steccherinum ochraceum TaxID=92696 RepID=A0A4V2MXF5_9APHY|nr:hypothetical protein EIP91_005761 [Steccherinum ochraceum]